MKAAELRIGNKILIDETVITVSYHEIRYATIHPNNNYNPILLNEDWLISLGFTLVEDNPFEHPKMKYWVKNRICLFFNESPPYNTYLLGFADMRFGKYSVTTGNWIEHVHVLQNAYYSLTSEELTLKEK